MLTVTLWADGQRFAPGIPMELLVDGLPLEPRAIAETDETGTVTFEPRVAATAKVRLRFAEGHRVRVAGKGK